MSTARCARAPRVAPARAPSASATTKPRARARATRARAFWDRFGVSKTDDVPCGENVDADARATATATATTTTRAAKPTAEDSLSALSALLGEDEREAKAARELEEADARRAEAQARERERKEAGAARRREFVKADAATTRIQRLQAVFLDVPLGMMDFSTMKDKTPGGEALGPEPEWFKLPTEVFDKVTGERFVVEEESDSGLELKPKGSGESEGDSGEIVRLPGEFQLPVIPYPFVATPGTYVRLNLFEPRWLTLFSKLIPGGDESATDKATESRPSIEVKTDEDGFGASTVRRRVLRGIDGKAKIDLNALPIIEAYETGARSFDIVPGFGRLPEDEFVDTNAFGAVFRGLDGQIASVGTTMEVQAHDVVVDGRLLSVCAKGTRRFKVLRVAQTEPYVIVDAVPIEDDDQSSVVTPDQASAEAVNEVFDLMKVVDPYYMEAIGLEDVSKSDVKDMTEFDLANVMYYTHPTLALKLLASKDSALRKRVVLASAKSFKRAIELGFTPRKSRLLSSFVNLALLFGVGFTILAIKNALEGDPSGLDDFY